MIERERGLIFRYGLGVSMLPSPHLALGHVVPGVEGDYRRRDALALRRHLMQQWAKLIEQPWGEHSHNIVKFHEGAA